MSSPKSGAPLADASIVDHETRHEDKPFTVYKIEIVYGQRKFDVYHRYSEFRELYEKLKDIFPREKLKFPAKRFLGKFDPEFLRARQQGLHEFVQKILSNPIIASHRETQAFFMPSAIKSQLGSVDDEVQDTEACPEGDERHFDLGAKENKKASVNDFTMLKVIGRGSFGKVLLARHKQSSELYAVKVLDKQIILKQNEVKHIMSERNVLLGNVDHPFLVGLHYSFQTPTKLYFVLDYINGGELFFHLQKEKRFAPKRVQFYAAELTSALGYLHNMNIVYRDLKPENVLFTSEGHVVLTDFGLCKMNVLPGEKTGTFCGTPEYLAPELLRKQAYGRSVDWWCLGCVVYEMLCGLPPFYSRDVNEMYDRILHSPLRFPEHVPFLARLWLEDLLIRDPVKRLGSGDGDVEDVKAHKYFSNIDFAALERKEIPPPWKPSLSSDLDLRNIDPEFVREPVPGSVAQPSMEALISVKVDAFDGFSYTADSALATDGSSSH